MNRKAIFLVFLALSGCFQPKVESDVSLIHWEEYESKPELYEGATIEMCGWFVSGMEQCTLSEGKNNRPDLAIWITPRSGICLPLKAFQNPIGQWATVSGEFHQGGGFGHLGMFNAALFKATIQLRHSPCETSEHEVN